MTVSLNASLPPFCLSSIRNNFVVADYYWRILLSVCVNGSSTSFSWTSMKLGMLLDPRQAAVLPTSSELVNITAPGKGAKIGKKICFQKFDSTRNQCWHIVVWLLGAQLVSCAAAELVWCWEFEAFTGGRRSQQAAGGRRPHQPILHLHQVAYLLLH